MENIRIALGAPHMMTEDAKPPIFIQETALLNDDDGQALGGSHVIEKDVKPPPFVQKIVKEEKAPLNDDDGFGLEEEKPAQQHSSKQNKTNKQCGRKQKTAVAKSKKKCNQTKGNNQNVNNTLPTYFRTVNKVNDIFTKSLENQLKEPLNPPTLQTVDTESGILSKSVENQLEEPPDSNNVYKDYIAKLEAKLNDETQAKQLVIANYKLLYQKYIKALVTVARLSKGLCVKQQNVTENRDIPEQHQNVNVTTAMLPNLILGENINPKDFLPEDAISEIEYISKKKEHDSTFVREILSRLYQDKGVLRNKSKKRMTPEKLNVIYQLFKKRIDLSDASIDEKLQRMNQTNINKLINWAKHNIVRKNKEENTLQ